MYDDIEQPLTPDQPATLDDVHMMASAIMEHFIEHERALVRMFENVAARHEELEATIAALRRQLHQPASPPPGALPVPAWLILAPTLPQQPPASGS